MSEPSEEVYEGIPIPLKRYYRKCLWAERIPLIGWIWHNERLLIEAIARERNMVIEREKELEQVRALLRNAVKERNTLRIVNGNRLVK